MFLFRAKKYLEYKNRAVNQYGLHSPFLFELYNTCFKPKFSHPFPEIDEARKNLRSGYESIEVTDFGAGSHVTNSRTRKVREMYDSASISRKQGELFKRLVNYFKPSTILELGTHLGVSGLYFLSNSEAHLTSVEACKHTQNLAKKTLRAFHSRVTLVHGTFREKLPSILESISEVDLVYIDGNHDYKNTIWHFEKLLEKVGEHSVLIFDDINWSKEMAEAWEEIIDHSQVSISVNCYKFGLVFFRKGVEKQNFYFKF